MAMLWIVFASGNAVAAGYVASIPWMYLLLVISPLWVVAIVFGGICRRERQRESSFYDKATVEAWRAKAREDFLRRTDADVGSETSV